MNQAERPCLWAVIAALLLWSAWSCKTAGQDDDEDEAALPRLTCVPYVSADDVYFYRQFEPGHGGIDLTATREIAIRAMCPGTFNKKLYYHPESLRWQVNCEILVGDYAVDYLFEPGSQVTEAQGRLQFDKLVADGSQVSAGELLGSLTLAPGNDVTLLHFGVRYRPANRTECPLKYATAEVQAQLQALAQRDHPGWQPCTIDAP
ncbi:MAG TPA: hypothetical protein PK919_07175 [Candidatus Aminicenantes bacterium]|nr:hypothetical protein [Candidatus Aminicenantes bacterium]